MGIELKKPFKDYVVMDMLPVTRDATNFVLHFVYQIEGTIKTERKQLPVTYTGTQAQLDANKRVDGLALQKERAIAALERGIARELQLKNERLYEVPGQKMPIWGKKSS
jgi:hypothetical protein